MRTDSSSQWGVRHSLFNIMKPNSIFALADDLGYGETEALAK